MQFKELTGTNGQTRALTEIKTRRRQGRKDVNPHLIPLLRSPATLEIPAPLDEVDVSFLRDNLAPARGIVYGLVFSALLWGGIGGGLWAALR